MRTTIISRLSSPAPAGIPVQQSGRRNRGSTAARAAARHATCALVSHRTLLSRRSRQQSNPVRAPERAPTPNLPSQSAAPVTPLSATLRALQWRQHVPQSSSAAAAACSTAVLFERPARRLRSPRRKGMSAHAACGTKPRPRLDAATLRTGTTEDTDAQTETWTQPGQYTTMPHNPQPPIWISAAHVASPLRCEHPQWRASGRGDLSCPQLSSFVSTMSDWMMYLRLIHPCDKPPISCTGNQGRGGQVVRAVHAMRTHGEEGRRARTWTRRYSVPSGEFFRSRMLTCASFGNG